MEVMVPMAQDTPSLDGWLDGLRERQGALLIPVRAHPGARREGPGGLHAGALKLATTAPADRGRATASLGRLLAELLDVPPSSVRCVSGATARLKTYAVEGLAPDEVRARLRAVLGGGRP